MRMSILNLCNRSRRKINNHLQYCHACVSSCAIDYERLQIPSVYYENIFTGLPSIPIPSFLTRTFIVLEGQMVPARYPSRCASCSSPSKRICRDACELERLW